MKKDIHIIGSGFSSLSAACYLAAEGHAVTVHEKNEQLGGRARQYVHNGFKFDMVIGGVEPGEVEQSVDQRMEMA